MGNIYNYIYKDNMFENPIPYLVQDNFIYSIHCIWGCCCDERLSLPCLELIYILIWDIRVIENSIWDIVVINNPTTTDIGYHCRDETSQL